MNALETWVDDAHRYLLGTRIATGGMGEVWRATDTSLGREVAVKLLKAEYANDTLFRSRFEAEARHAAALTHPGIAAVYDVGESTPLHGVRRPYLVMELVEGQPLNNLLRPGAPMSAGVVRSLLSQVGDALGAAHRAGIVHRDVKPGNLLVTPERQVKVTDFGIARAADAVALTQTGQVMGTPQYLSPEQAEGKPAGPASDVYALAVVAYECLAGRRPFDAESPVATALAHLRNPVPPLPDTVPADLAAVVMRGLSKNPDVRYPDGAAFAAALRDPATAAHGLATSPVDDFATTFVPVAPPVDETRLVPAAPEPDTGEIPLTGATPEAAGEDEKKSPMGLIIAGLLALVLVLGGLTWWLVSGDGDGRPDEPSTSTSPSPEPSDDVSEEPETVAINPDDYVGRDIEDVVAELQRRDLRPDRQPRENPGTEQENRVVSLDPTGTLEVGDRITVVFWGPQPAPSPTPTPTQSSAPTPTEPPSPTPSQTPVPTPSTPPSETPAPTQPPASDAADSEPLEGQ